ncbi:MAG: hypothetical protein LBT51_02945 [Fusobacteriaceae bacterium]|jgi:hypothetical protein|nr:hypothetical protein [Fusobacteriaceae bacterium]
MSQLPTIYIIFIIVFIIAAVGIPIFFNKRAKAVRENVDTTQLMKDTVTNSYSNYSGLELIAGASGQEFSDAAKDFAKEVGKRAALRLVGLKRRGGYEQEVVQYIVGYDDNRTVLMPVYADLFTGSMVAQSEYQVEEIKYSELTGLKVSEENGQVVFNKNKNDKIVIDVSEKDFFSKDQAIKFEKYTGHLLSIKTRLGF